MSTDAQALRVLAADEDVEALAALADVLQRLGHQVTSYAVGVTEAIARIGEDDPDVAVVMLHSDMEHALDLIDEISEYARGPVVALLDGEDPSFVSAAAERGIFAYARSATPETVQGAIEVAVRRHAETRALAEEVDQLKGALERRAVIERAKGILMERHSIDERAAFSRLREHARGRQQTVVSIAQAVGDGHALLPGK